MTDVYHKPVQRAFRQAGFDTRNTHPYVCCTQLAFFSKTFTDWASLFSRSVYSRRVPPTDISPGCRSKIQNWKESVGQQVSSIIGAFDADPTKARTPFSPFGKLLFEEYITKIDIARVSPELTLDVPAAGSKR